MHASSSKTSSIHSASSLLASEPQRIRDPGGVSRDVLNPDSISRGASDVLRRDQQHHNKSKGKGISRSAVVLDLSDDATPEPLGTRQVSERGVGSISTDAGTTLPPPTLAESTIGYSNNWPDAAAGDFFSSREQIAAARLRHFRPASQAALAMPHQLVSRCESFQAAGTESPSSSVPNTSLSRAGTKQTKVEDKSAEQTAGNTESKKIEIVDLILD